MSAYGGGTREPQEFVTIEKSNTVDSPYSRGFIPDASGNIKICLWADINCENPKTFPVVQGLQYSMAVRRFYSTGSDSVNLTGFI